SSALTRKSGVLCARRNAIAGAQYEACWARSSCPLTKLHTSGEMLYAAATSASGAARASGRPRNTSSAKGSAMKRSRAAFSPSVDGKTNDNATSASQATKTPRIGRPGASTIAPTQKSAAAVASCHEKGKRPGLRNTSTSGGYATTRANAAAATPADSAASTLIPTTTANG